MDSAAAYSMTLPDEGAAAWDGIAFAGRAVVSIADGRYSFEVFSVSGSGDVVFDFGDGETHTVTFPSGTTNLDGEVVDGYSTPLFRHEYAADGVYEIRVAGALASLGLAGKHRPAGRDQSYSTTNTVVDETSALHDIWHMAVEPERHDMIGWWSVDVAVVDSDHIGWQLPWYEFDDSGNVTSLWNTSGPRKLVMRGLTGSRPIGGVVSGVHHIPTIALFNLEEFWAPNVTEFGATYGVPENSTITPFGFCDNMKVVYVPSLTRITKRVFVSPSATGVKIYAGRLDAIHGEAFGIDASSPDLPTFVTPGHGSVELFCGNTRQEILNLADYPFGADYLKCHCVDVTFDNRGSFWRASDGRRVDSAGRLIDEQGRFVDESGHLVRYHEGLARWITCDEYGFYVDADDMQVDPVTGFWVDRDEHVCDESGRKRDTLGALVDYKYWDPVDGWVTEDSGGNKVDYWSAMHEGSTVLWQFVVDRTGVKVESRKNVVLTGTTYEEDDPRRGTFMALEPTVDGFVDYYDASGFLRARERTDLDTGTTLVYSVVYSGWRSWQLDLYSTSGGEEVEP